MEKKILDILKKNELILPNGHVILGISGGPDSVCLFSILKKLESILNFKLYAVHINHNLRGEASIRDEMYVKKICELTDTPLYVFSEDCMGFASTQNVGTEEAGRILRYRSFKKVQDELIDAGVSRDNICVAVAHNKEDQAETILFRIIRGTGLDGLAGMDIKSQGMFDLTIIRPLIDISRFEIEKYCSEHKLTPCIDKTNAETVYTRNKIRIELMPYLKKLNPNIVDTIVRLGKNVYFDKKKLWRDATKVYELILNEDNSLDLNALRKLDKSTAHRIYEMALNEIEGVDIEASHLLAIDKIVYSESDNPSLSVDLPNDILVSRSYDKLIFLDRKNIKSLMDYDQFDIKIVKGSAFQSDNVYAAFDADKIKNKLGMKNYEVIDNILKNIEIRKRQDGDFIRLKNLGTKKLQDFLVDAKVPKIYRKYIDVVALGKEILWILPNSNFPNDILKEKGRMSGNYSIDIKTKNILTIEKKF